MNRTISACPMRRIRKPTTVSESFLAPTAAPPVKGGAAAGATRWLLCEVPVFGEEGVQRAERDVLQLAAHRLDGVLVRRPDERQLLRGVRGVLLERRQAAVRVGGVDQLVHRRVRVAARVRTGSGGEKRLARRLEAGTVVAPAAKPEHVPGALRPGLAWGGLADDLSLIHISEPTRLGMISYAVFCLKKKKKKKNKKTQTTITKKK